MINTDKLVINKIAIPYKKVLGKLCHQNENIVLEALKNLDNNQKIFNDYKIQIKKYLASIRFSNKNFDKQLLNLFEN